MQPANVTICTPFRDSEAHLQTYMQQLYRLNYPPESLRFVAVEGDSNDQTVQHLRAWADQSERATFLRCDTGKPKYGSVINPERFALLASVFNLALDAVNLDWSDYVLFLPCDIAYSPDLLIRLIAHNKDIIAPMVWIWLNNRHVFYDTWGFIFNGKRFGHYTQAEIIASFGSEPARMDTVGGTVLIKAKVLRAGCRYSPTQVDRGLCRAAYQEGFTVWADPCTNVYHPPFAPASLPDLVDPQSRTTGNVRSTILTNYGFDPGEQYAADFVKFVDILTRGNV